MSPRFTFRKVRLTDKWEVRWADGRVLGYVTKHADVWTAHRHLYGPAAGDRYSTREFAAMALEALI